MASAKNRERILEAIDQLRGRKARPDIQRICNYLFRRFAMNSVEAKADLEWCVANNIVLRVEYKGSISYRNAAKKFAQMRPYKQRAGAAASSAAHNDKSHIDKIGTTPNRQFSELLTNAIGELIIHEPDYLEMGVPCQEIVNNILSKDSVRYTKKYINILLEKEVERGGLIRMENGNYILGPSKDEDDVKPRNNHSSAPWKNNHNSKTETTKSQTINIMKHDDRTTLSWKSDKIEKVQSQSAASSKLEKDNRSHNESDYYMQVKSRGKNEHERDTSSLNRSKFDNNMESGNSTDDKKSDSGSLRIGGRRKRAKKVFDPSDNHVPKKRGRPVGSLNKSTIEKQLARMNDNDFSQDNNKATSSTSSRDNFCFVCHVQIDRGSSSDSMLGNIISCKECNNKAHRSCLLDPDDMMLRMNTDDDTWHCPHCKFCVVCDETSEGGKLSVCYVCIDAYHTFCHRIPIRKGRHGGRPWVCYKCEEFGALCGIGNLSGSKNGGRVSSRKSNYSEINDASPSNSGSSSPSYNNSPPLSPTPPNLSPQNVVVSSHHHHHSNNSSNNTRTTKNNSNRRSSPADDDAAIRRRSDDSPPGGDDDNKDFDSMLMDDNIDPSIPDATHWTPDEVAKYFAQWFPEESKIFKEQQIDGRSLLLLKRIDVLTNLNLKLGPALKIYRHVVKLQVRRDDPKLYWL